MNLKQFLIFLFISSIVYSDSNKYFICDQELVQTIIIGANASFYDTTTNVRTELHNGDSITFISTDLYNEWYLVKYKNKIGMVVKDYVKYTSANDCIKQHTMFVKDTCISITKENNVTYFCKGQPLVVFDSTGNNYITISRSILTSFDTINKKLLSTTCNPIETDNCEDLCRRYTYCKNNKLNKTMFDLILNGEVKLGMNKEQLLASWGKPDDINRTVTKYGVHEQWIYGDSYIYLDNGIITSFQD